MTQPIEDIIAWILKYNNPLGFILFIFIMVKFVVKDRKDWHEGGDAKKKLTEREKVFAKSNCRSYIRFATPAICLCTKNLRLTL